jgi:hypothetical protein
MSVLRKIGAGYFQLKDDFLLKKILKDVNPVDISSSDKLFIFNHRTSSYYLNLYVLLAHALSKKGYPSCFLFRDRLLNRYFPNVENFSEQIDVSNILSIKNFEVGPYLQKLIIDEKEISNSLIQAISKTKIIDKYKTITNYKWEIDFKKELIRTHNINFFPIILNTLRIIFKKYNIDFSDEKVISISNKLIKSCDLLLFYFFKLKQYSVKNKIKIRLVGWELSYVPNGVFKLLCDYLSKNRDIEYIDLARGYAKYFRHHYHESYIAVSNLTYSGKANRLVLNKKDLNSITKNYTNDYIFLEVNKIIKKPVQKNFKPQQKKIIKKINDYKSSKIKVLVLFTHLFFDTPLDDSTPSFKGMCDWITTTINYFKKNENLLLLKPHPNEIRPDAIQREPNETLKSFLENNKIKLTNNIILLKPRDFRLNEIVSFIDCGLIWRSSAAMELAIYDKPCIISGSPPYKILGFYYVRDRKNYFNMIENVEKLKVTEDLKLNVARYIIGLKNQHIYIQTILHNKRIKRNYLDENLLDEYLKNGDKNIDFLINEILK